MGQTFLRYFNTLFLARMILFTLGLSGILSLFDVLANAGEVTKHSDAVFSPLVSYISLRYPEILNAILPLAGLLAALSVFTQKVGNQEMIAVRSVGVSIYSVITLLLVGAGIIMTLHFVLLNAVLPVTSHKLHLWSELDYRGAPPERRMDEQIPNWIADGDTIIKLGSASPDGRHLKNLTVVTRGEKGLMKKYFTAYEARFKNKAWHLSGVEYPGQFSQKLSTEKIVLNLPIKPGYFAKTVDQKNALSLSDLWRLTKDGVVFDKPPYVYDVWLHQKFSHPFALVVMILLSAPVGLKLARRDSLLLSTFYVVTAGFLYFIAERLIATLGENGFIPAMMAAWAPAAIFSLLALWLIILKEG